MSSLLLFSGGVDSTVCLKNLVAQNVIPTIFHFKTQKLKKKHERMIRTVAKQLSPKSPFYVFETWTHDYEATWDKKYPYYYVRWRKSGKNQWVCPLLYADNVVIGYTRWIYHYHENQKRFKGNQHELIDFCSTYNLPFTFPLKLMKRTEIDAELNKLPIQIRHNIVSSTRNYSFGGIFVKPKSR